MLREPESRFVRGESGGRLHLADWGGEGLPLLLLHGMGAHTHWWDRVAPLLSRGFHVVALDMRGHGDSCRADRYAMGGYVHDVEYVRRGMGWSRMFLAGHSLGARVALSYAKLYRSKLRRLALLDFLTEAKEKDRKYEGRKKHRQPTYASSEMMVKRFKLQPPGTTLPRAELQRLARDGIRQLENGRWTWKFDWRAFYLHYPPIWEELPEILVPCLVMRGQKSSVMSADDLERVTQGLPGSAGIEIPKVYHHITLDAPGAVAEHLLDFFVPADGSPS